MLAGTARLWFTSRAMAATRRAFRRFAAPREVALA